MPASNVIGEYLRARRGLVQPDDVGLRDLGRRRAPGLRREEVAMLAGVSADYYMRLEQGRDQHPSAQVLERWREPCSSTRTRPPTCTASPSPGHSRRRRRAGPSAPPMRSSQLIMSWPTTPAYVFGRYLDVLAANPLATALAPWFTVGENLVKRRIPRSAAARAKARLGRDRSAARSPPCAPTSALRSTIHDSPSSSGSSRYAASEFRQLWARHDARPKGSGRTVMHHPQVGRLELVLRKLPIPDSDRQTLSIYHAAPGSPSERALTLLATTTVREREPERTLSD